MTNNNTPTYPVCLDLTALPPIHNHMIGAVQAITLDNVIGTVALIQRLLLDQPNLELRLSERETEGLTSILENLHAALLFEVSYRERPEDDSPEPLPDTAQ